MDSAGSMRNVHCNIADLAEAVGTSVYPKQLGDAKSRLGTVPSRRSMLREG